MLDELIGHQALERGMRAVSVVVDAPCFNRAASMEDRREHVLVMQLVPEPAVRAHSSTVLRRFARIDKILSDARECRTLKHLIADGFPATSAF
jgi:hypothetical protein